MSSELLKKQCPKCGSTNTVKDGIRYNQSGEKKQRWCCRKCGTSFAHEGYFRGKHELALLQYANMLYKQGLSSRQVRDLIQKNCRVYVSHTTISRWARMFGSIRPKNPHSYNPQDPKRVKINTVTEIEVITVVHFADSKHPRKSIVLETCINISESPPFDTKTVSQKQRVGNKL